MKNTRTPQGPRSSRTFSSRPPCFVDLYRQLPTFPPDVSLSYHVGKPAVVHATQGQTSTRVLCRAPRNSCSHGGGCLARIKRLSSGQAYGRPDTSPPSLTRHRYVPSSHGA